MNFKDRLIRKITNKILGENLENKILEKTPVEKISSKIAEDNRNIENALIELFIEVNANFINNVPSLSVSFPVPIEDNTHKILEYKFYDCDDKYKECKIENGLAILNFRKNFKKGEQENCKIYFKIKSHAYNAINDNPTNFPSFGKYTFLSDETKKFVKNFNDNNVRKTAEKISSWIFLNLKYSDIDEMKDAEWIFKNKIGNCVHYSTLFIAFCRYLGIPCRYVLGFAKYGKFYPHTWVEFYDKENFSWVPMDIALNQKFFVDATHIPISRFEEKQVRTYFKEVNLEIPKDQDEIFKIMNFGTESVVKEDAHVEIDVRGKLISEH